MRSTRLPGSLTLIGALALLVVAATAPGAAAKSPIVLRDFSAKTGITFQHTDGSSGRRYIIESMSAGLASFDYDGDGLIDLYFLNGAPLPGAKADTTPRNALYRNLGGFKFADVTRLAGVGDPGYGLGVAVADYDNDGHLDIYVNNYGPNVLYRNRGNGTFSEVAEAARVVDGRKTGAGTAFLDADGDGHLDLYVGHYVQFSPDRHVKRMFMGVPAYPSPLDFPPEPDTFYHNNADGTFTDVSQASGIAKVAGTSMGMVCADFDNDGDTDIFIANDVMPNFLFENDGKGRFEEIGLLAGVAYNASGMPHGNMGVDCGDYDNDGWLDFYVTAFQRELATLFRNLGNGCFADMTRPSGAGARTFSNVTWGCGLVDFDNDGYKDIYVATGHLDDNVELRDDTTSYHATDFLLRNDGKGKFIDVSAESGDGMAVKLCSRGAVFDDLDNDGRVDVVVLNSRREPTILRNESPRENHWLQVRLTGVKTNRDGVGARVKLVAGDLTLVDEVHSGRGYQSHSGMRLHFGLGKRTRVDRLEIRWIGGGVDVIEDLPVDRMIAVVEGMAGRS